MSLYGLRYLEAHKDADSADIREFKRFVRDELHYTEYRKTMAWYAHISKARFFDDNCKAFLGCNDRFFLLTALLGRRDALKPWLFSRCREVGGRH